MNSCSPPKRSCSVVFAGQSSAGSSGDAADSDADAASYNSGPTSREGHSPHFWPASLHKRSRITNVNVVSLCSLPFSWRGSVTCNRVQTVWAAFIFLCFNQCCLAGMLAVGCILWLRAGGLVVQIYVVQLHMEVFWGQTLCPQFELHSVCVCVGANEGFTSAVENTTRMIKSIHAASHSELMETE